MTNPNDPQRGSFDHNLVHGTIEGHEVTASFGQGGNEGHTLIADGLKTPAEFWQGKQHDHYGPGNGPNDNGTNRGWYTGPGA